MGQDLFGSFPFSESSSSAGMPGTIGAPGGSGGGVGIPGTGINSEVHNVLVPASASGWGAFAEGQGEASGFLAHAEGNAVASGNYAHAEGGAGSEAVGNLSHSEAIGKAHGQGSHAEGSSRTGAAANDAHAEGTNNDANGAASHAEGSVTLASGDASHAEGASSEASGFASHAEGQLTTASGNYSHAEGLSTSATGSAAHSEGGSTSATGSAAHAEGSNTVAAGNHSHAGGLGNKAHFAQTAIGIYAEDDGISDIAETDGQDLLKVGDGTSNIDRLNVFSVSKKMTSGFGRAVFPNLSDITTNRLRVAIIGDSIASSGSSGGFLEFAIMQCKGFWSRVVNAGIGGNTLIQMDARFDADIAPFFPDVVFISGGSNDATLTQAVKDAVISLAKKCRKIRARPIFILPAQKVGFTGSLAIMGNWISNYCSSQGIESIQPWDNLLVQSTGILNPAALDGLGVHPLHPYAYDAGTVIALNRVIDAKRRPCMGLLTNGTAGQNTWVIDPYNTGGTVDKGARWTLTTSAGGTATPTKSATASPDLGLWQNAQFSLPATSGANGDFNLAAPGGVPIPAGDFLVCYRVKITECTNASVDMYLNFNNDAGVDVGGGRKSYLSSCRGLVDGTVTYTLQAPAGAYRPELKFKITKVNDLAAATLTISVAMIELRTLVS